VPDLLIVVLIPPLLILLTLLLAHVERRVTASRSRPARAQPEDPGGRGGLSHEALLNRGPGPGAA
jgi:hypothetical protein